MIRDIDFQGFVLFVFGVGVVAGLGLWGLFELISWLISHLQWI